MISKAGIESALAAIEMLCTSTRHKFAELVAPSIYSKLCWITTAIVQLHAEALRGRMHLVVPVLKALLTCLFTTDGKPPKGLKPPTWMETKKVPLNERLM